MDDATIKIISALAMIFGWRILKVFVFDRLSKASASDGRKPYTQENYKH